MSIFASLFQKPRPINRTMGIVREGHWLLWGYDHGFMLGAPKWLKESIILSWNRVTCRIWRHWQFQDVCVMCCKKMELP